jgi:hypothetical protein
MVSAHKFMRIMAANHMPLHPVDSRSSAGGETVKSIKRETMEIKRNSSQPSGRGPAEYFTRAIRIDTLFQADDPARAAENRRGRGQKSPH